MRVRDYAQAAFELMTAGNAADSVLKNLNTTLKRRGHVQLYPRVLKELLRREERRLARSKTVVTVGRVADISRHDAAIEKSLGMLNAKNAYETNIDPTIIGGFKVAQHDRVIDNTYKRRLVALYQSIIG